MAIRTKTRIINNFKTINNKCTTKGAMASTRVEQVAETCRWMIRHKIRISLHSSVSAVQDWTMTERFSNMLTTALSCSTPMVCSFSPSCNSSTRQVKLRIRKVLNCVWICIPCLIRSKLTLSNTWICNKRSQYQYQILIRMHNNKTQWVCLNSKNSRLLWKNINHLKKKSRIISS